mgnify:CR=1 FL=1
MVVSPQFFCSLLMTPLCPQSEAKVAIFLDTPLLPSPPSLHSLPKDTTGGPFTTHTHTQNTCISPHPFLTARENTHTHIVLSSMGSCCSCCTKDDHKVKVCARACSWNWCSVCVCTYVHVCVCGCIITVVVATMLLQPERAPLTKAAERVEDIQFQEPTRPNCVPESHVDGAVSHFCTNTY